MVGNYRQAIAAFHSVLRYHFIFCGKGNLTYGSFREIKCFRTVIPTDKFIGKVIVFRLYGIGSGLLNLRADRKRARIANNRTVVYKRYVGVNEGYLPIERGGIRAICQVKNKVKIVEYDCVLIALRIIENTVKDKLVPVFKLLP